MDVVPNAVTTECDLLVIGTGMTGMAATLFALNRGLTVVQAGKPGAIVFASGLLDLMGVHPLEEKKPWQDPWAAIEAVSRDIPDHPYARLEKADIRDAIDEFCSFLSDAGLPYCRIEDRNSDVLTPIGTVKRTYCVPRSMWKGVEALADKAPCLLVEFDGFHDFSARQISVTLKARWPSLRWVRVPFPDSTMRHEVAAGELTARALAAPENMEALAISIKPHIGAAQAVGLPAVCGMERSVEVVDGLSELIGVPVFEIPTFPVSVPGLRLMQTFERELPKRAGYRLFRKRVLDVRCDHGKDFMAGIGDDALQATVGAKGVLLATGRFMSKALYAERDRIRETLFDLPVSQSESRSQWHHHDFFDPRGHLANRAGLEVDHAFRPLGRMGGPAHETLFAAGSILAHQDWMRMKCGSGLAIATAYAVVKSFLGLKK